MTTKIETIPVFEQPEPEEAGWMAVSATATRTEQTETGKVKHSFAATLYAKTGESVADLVGIYGEDVILRVARNGIKEMVQRRMRPRMLRQAEQLAALNDFSDTHTDHAGLAVIGTTWHEDLEKKRKTLTQTVSEEAFMDYYKNKATREEQWRMAASVLREEGKSDIEIHRIIGTQSQARKRDMEQARLQFAA